MSETMSRESKVKIINKIAFGLGLSKEQLERIALKAGVIKAKHKQEKDDGKPIQG